MQVKSVIADFNGRNQDFRKYMVASEKNEPNGGRDFKAILATAVKNNKEA